MAPLRLFIALWPAGARRVAASDQHLTLAFIGALALSAGGRYSAITRFA